MTSFERHPARRYIETDDVHLGTASRSNLAAVTHLHSEPVFRLGAKQKTTKKKKKKKIKKQKN